MEIAINPNFRFYNITSSEISINLDYILRTLILICDGSILYPVRTRNVETKVITSVINFHYHTFTFQQFINILDIMVQRYVSTDTQKISYFIYGVIQHQTTVEFHVNNTNANNLNNTNANNLNNMNNLNNNNEQNTLLLTLQIFDCSLNEYAHRNIHSKFDCNSMYTTYQGTYLYYSLIMHFDVSYQDIANRALKFRFCYTDDNMNNLCEYLTDPQFHKNYWMSDKDKKKYHEIYINQFLYASRLIHKGWIMDEYLLREESWTINYWEIYLKMLNVIKYRQVMEMEKISTDKTYCALCQRYFRDRDVILNQKNMYTHLSCVNEKLLK